MRAGVWLLAFLLSAWPVVAQTATSDDQAAIRAIEAQWEAAWNQHDPAALARLATADADFVNVRGAWGRGRDQFEKNQAAQHRTTEKDSVWRTTDVQIRFVTPEVAVAHVYWTMTGLRNAEGASLPPRLGLTTQTLVKRDGKWLITASQATNVISP